MPHFAPRLLLLIVSALCIVAVESTARHAAAQQVQFVQPTVIPTGGKVTSFLTGNFAGSSRTDFSMSTRPP
jgi:hypothetical protein